MIPVSLSLTVSDSKITLTARDDASASIILVAHLSPGDLARLISGSVPTVPAHVVKNLETRRIGQRPNFATHVPPPHLADSPVDHPTSEMIFHGESVRALANADTATWHRESGRWQLSLVTWVPATDPSAATEPLPPPL